MVRLFVLFSKLLKPNPVFQRELSSFSPCLFSSVNSFSDRTHTCGELRQVHAGQKVKICGWIQYQRLGKFITLRDAYGVVQIIVPPQKTDLSKQLFDLPFESVISVEGIVKERPADQINEKQKTGEIEIELENIDVLSKSLPKLPFIVRDFSKVSEPLRMQHRYLDLRHEMMQRNLRIRSSLVMKMREFLANQHGFVDVETPTLFKRTPGGAQEFVVPTRFPNRFYSLVQSPQQFKQMLMVGGIDRYFQIARCYRDEGTRPDRQPEFTQVDIEMSFVNRHGIQKLIEGLIDYVWPKDLGTEFRALKVPFPEMTYEDAMNRYGVDKPDTRFENLLENITELAADSELKEIFRMDGGTSAVAVKFENAEKFVTRKVQDELSGGIKDTGSDTKLITAKIRDDGLWTSSIAKRLSEATQKRLSARLAAKTSDVIFICIGPKDKALSSAGKLRLDFASVLETHGLEVRTRTWNFLWVVDFPLFLRGETEHSVESAHHPFTAPHPEDADLLFSDPLKVRGLHYDLVLNGCEIGGGSIRIHQADLQKYVLDNILKEDSSKLEHLIYALQCGCPPHGGIALGLDRFVALICNAKSIRDVIAFPKSLDGKDLLSGAPSPISEKEREIYHLK